MKEYEAVWEIFNQCSNNQMRDVFFEEVETDDLEKYVDRFCTGQEVTRERTDKPDGSVIFDINTDGLAQRISFCEA